MVSRLARLFCYSTPLFKRLDSVCGKPSVMVYKARLEQFLTRVERSQWDLDAPTERLTQARDVSPRSSSASVTSRMALCFHGGSTPVSQSALDSRKRASTKSPLSDDPNSWLSTPQKAARGSHWQKSIIAQNLVFLFFLFFLVYSFYIIVGSVDRASYYSSIINSMNWHLF